MSIATDLKHLNDVLKERRPYWTARLRPGAGEADLNLLRKEVAPLRVPEEIIDLFRWHDGEAPPSIADLANPSAIAEFGFSQGGIKPTYEFLSLSSVRETYGEIQQLVVEGILPSGFRRFLPVFHTTSRRDVGVWMANTPYVSPLVAVDVEYRELYLIATSMKSFVDTVSQCMEASVYEKYGIDDQDPLRYSEQEAAVSHSTNGPHVMPNLIDGVTRFRFDTRELWPKEWQ